MIKKAVLLVVLSILIFGAFVATSKAKIDLIGPAGGPQRLWSTNVNGLAEINAFSAGDAIYLKTDDDASYPTGDSQGGITYRVYIFAGNKFTGGSIPATEAKEGDPISSPSL